MGELIRHVAENLNTIGLFYRVFPIVVANRVTGIAAPTAGRETIAWNAHQWDVTR
jgi:hypothetical protein